ncbi:hypothetical protein JW826_05295 [Candidatus Woesearchaeota archaeon]|nr:hypothetical protein [Candidatus Woesearchaeota archaeon]
MINKKDRTKIRAELGRLLLLVQLVLIIVVLLSWPSSAHPPLPTEFYGRMRDYNNNASVGEVVNAYDESGTLCGTFIIVNQGYYGVLTCTGDDPETSADEGAVAGENITFRYKGSFTTARGEVTWELGTFKNVNLTYPVVYCGDYFCDAEYESTFTCPFDCPQYNASQNVTTNATSNTTGNATGGGTGTGSGGGGGGGGGAAGGTTQASITMRPRYLVNFTGNYSGADLGFDCIENWICTNWTECGIDGMQNRTCTDRNFCGTTEEKPPETQKCVYTPTCYDGVKNGYEDGIDCGGLCPPCIGCFDGVQNCHAGGCEEGVDCGGPCPACPSCYDGIKNCHDDACEDGIDCGGPCEKRCPLTQAPFPLLVCKKDINPFNNRFIIFFIIVLLVIGGNFAYSEMKVREVRACKHMKGIDRARKILEIRRKALLFTVILVLVSIVIYMYYYFFIMCETEYKYIWILLLMLVSIPIIVHELIRYLEYSESKKIQKMAALLRSHEEQVEWLIKMQKDNASEIIEGLVRELEGFLGKGSDLPSQILLSLKRVLKDTKSVLEGYLFNRPADAEEESLSTSAGDCVELLYGEKHKAVLEKHDSLVKIGRDLKVVLEYLSDKKNLSEELAKIRNSSDGDSEGASGTVVSDDVKEKNDVEGGKNAALDANSDSEGDKTKDNPSDQPKQEQKQEQARQEQA